MPETAYGFQVHPGRESWNVTSEILNDLVTNHSEWRVGVTLQLPRQKLAYWLRANDDWEDMVDWVLADPETGRLDQPYDERGRGRDDLAYLSIGDPMANRVRFVETTLAAQRAAAPSAVISPWLTHGISGTEDELHATVAFAQLADERRGDDAMLVGLQATQGVFANETARNAMINELVELPEHPVYLRMQITPPSGYKQYQQLESLNGLRDVVRALGDNERATVLPQSGLMGWLMTAFGATTFGAGMAASMQRNVPPSGGGGGFAPLHWYYVPQMLGFVQAEEMPDVAAIEGFVPCGCLYCGGNLPTPGPNFDAELAGKHFLLWCTRLAGELDPTLDALPQVRSRVDDAMAFAAAVTDRGVVLDPRSQPTHLAVWDAVLRG